MQLLVCGLVISCLVCISCCLVGNSRFLIRDGRPIFSVFLTAGASRSFSSVPWWLVQLFRSVASLVPPSPLNLVNIKAYSLRKKINIHLENFKHITSGEKWSHYPYNLFYFRIENHTVYFILYILSKCKFIETRKITSTKHLINFILFLYNFFLTFDIVSIRWTLLVFMR